jgi:glucose-6-phosphate 1-dehydrogenase
MKKTDEFLIVIFGASGDLTHRKLLPSIYSLYCQNLLPKSWAILGVGRKEWDDTIFRDHFKTHYKNENPHCNQLSSIDQFNSHLYFLSMDSALENEYPKLTSTLLDIQTKNQLPENYLFYLSTPPILYSLIPKHLASQNLNNEINGWKRIIIEKPFGYDLKSAKQLNQDLLNHYHEHQIYRIDHYLGKETVQNLLVFRFANEFFEPLWNKNYIDYIEVTASESLGIENRGGYYDASGALRDMVQNHLFQLLAMVTMEAPAQFDSRSVRNETLKVFQSIRPLNENIEENVVLGQYTSSKIKSENINAYREEDGVPSNSRTETYAALKLFIDNRRWNGIPFYIRTGKRLPTRVSEVVIHFRKTPYSLLGFGSEQNTTHNQLVLRIQPDEGILLKFGLKVPGSGFNVQTVDMNFHYNKMTNTYIPSAYERLILDCIMGDATLYSRGDAVEACWDLIDPILKWKEKEATLYGYPAGSWGPTEADKLLENDGFEWRFPCKNLTEDGLYCEL